MMLHRIIQRIEQKNGQTLTAIIAMELLANRVYLNKLSLAFSFAFAYSLKSIIVVFLSIDWRLSKDTQTSSLFDVVCRTHDRLRLGYLNRWRNPSVGPRRGKKS